MEPEKVINLHAEILGRDDGGIRHGSGEPRNSLRFARSKHPRWFFVLNLIESDTLPLDFVACHADDLYFVAIAKSHDRRTHIKRES